MTAQKPAGAKKGGGIIGALMDLLILVLLLGAAGGGGYLFGLNQRLAPVQLVGPGTPGAQPAPPPAATAPAAPPQNIPAGATPKADSTATTTAATPTASTPSSSEADKTKTEKNPGKLKYWLCSSGTEYTGYSITVSVNGVQVDNFFGPGKSVDVTRHVKDGENTVLFSARVLPKEYNKHKGDSKSVLTVRLVSGPSIQEDFKPEDVVLEYQRNASESESSEDTMHFSRN